MTILYSVFSLPGLYGFLPLVGRSLKSNFEVIGISFFGPLFFIGAMTVVVVALIGNIDLLFNVIKCSGRIRVSLKVVVEQPQKVAD